MSGMFSRQERAVILDARNWAENRSYDARRSRFYEFLRRLGSHPDNHSIRFAYAIGQNLVLDESDIADIMNDVWGISPYDIGLY